MGKKKNVNLDENNLSQLDRVNEYRAGFQLYNGVNVYITLKLDPNWDVFGSEDQTIIAVKDNSDSSIVYVYGVEEGITIKTVVDHIERIIEHNINSQKRYQVCSEKAEEFKTLLNRLTLEELNTLTFNYKGKPKSVIKKETVLEEVNQTQSDSNNNVETKE